ncbi:GNAT family N-acetyltransferase [Amycolatopsis cynarae]|uniref:GNAT family N-acetyltransferase n=1 Tax=Amycolatopsis cynarae TaxID=2995223 RepID=A0ABY7AST9_9PSEU|nr:GNAT family N-acetyltransferase [Amycolatopsis sp. HUAS 11-8]WAL63011.1 GNAT family N-acetyltransferase [Amycolatopsis sp. HUAS 11-8]
MEPSTTLTDGEVRLRRWRVKDAVVLHRAVNESLDHLAPWMPWAVDGYSEADAIAYLRLCQERWRTGEAFDYALVGAEEEILGSASLMARLAPGALEIGYWIGQPHTGRGLATRASALLAAEAFRIGARSVEIHHDQANVRSGKIPERLGFTRIGTVPPKLPGGTASTGVLVVWRKTVPGAGE